MSLRFVKMNGLGNDFVIVPTDVLPFEPRPDQVRALAGRVSGIGCDQVIAITPSDCAHAGMRIWNADGDEVEHCGNAVRCVSWLMMRALGLDQVRVETPSGVLRAHRDGSWGVTVDMGEPRLGWRDIPLAWEIDTREIRLPFDEALGAPGCVSMGNPHVTFFVPDATTTKAETLGPVIERHWLFPRRVNVGFAQIVRPDRIRLRVWERGAGLTKACGTGACAAVVAAQRRGLCDRRAVVEMDGGELWVDWSEADNHVRMTGPVSVEFTGYLPPMEIAA